MLHLMGVDDGSDKKIWTYPLPKLIKSQGFWKSMITTNPGGAAKAWTPALEFKL